jgi:serine protease Do
MGFGIGAGAASVLAAALAVAPAVQGSGDEAPQKDEAAKTKKVDRRVRIQAGGGPRLGVRLEDLEAEDVTRLKLPEEKGALVTRVEEDSPAAKAGIQKDDVIVRYHGENVLGASQLARLVRETPKGRTVPIEVLRQGNTQRLSATLADGRDHMSFFREGDGPEFELVVPEPPEAPLAPVPPIPPMAFERFGRRALLDDFGWFGPGPRKLGLEYQEIGGQLAKYFKLTGEGGVLVTSVEEDGPAGKAGLRAGDVILKLDGRSVDDGDDLRRAVQKAEPGREITVSVQREGRILDLKLTPAGERRRGREGAEL